MKKTIFLLLLFVSTIIFGQTRSKVNRKTTIDKENISYARIGKYLSKPKCISDSCWDILYRNLSSEQTLHFVDQWNNADYVGKKKVKPTYCVDLYLKDGSKKTIRINKYLNEINIYQFTIQDKNLLSKMWDTATEN